MEERRRCGRTIREDGFRSKKMMENEKKMFFFLHIYLCKSICFIFERRKKKQDRSDTTRLLSLFSSPPRYAGRCQRLSRRIGNTSGKWNHGKNNNRKRLHPCEKSSRRRCINIDATSSSSTQAYPDAVAQSLARRRDRRLSFREEHSTFGCFELSFERGKGRSIRKLTRTKKQKRKQKNRTARRPRRERRRRRRR